MTISGFICLFTIIFIFTILLTCAATDVSPVLTAIIFFIGTIGLLVYWHLTPSISTMYENKYKNILNNRPGCMNDPKQNETIECLNKYKYWLEDSLHAVYKIDSIKAVRDSIKENINLIKGTK